METPIAEYARRKSSRDIEFACSQVTALIVCARDALSRVAAREIVSRKVATSARVPRFLPRSVQCGSIGWVYACCSMGLVGVMWRPKRCSQGMTVRLLDLVLITFREEDAE